MHNNKFYMENSLCKLKVLQFINSTQRQEISNKTEYGNMVHIIRIQNKDVQKMSAQILSCQQNRDWSVSFLICFIESDR